MDTKLRIIFFGTPDFAVPTLEALKKANFCGIKAVVNGEECASRVRKPRYLVLLDPIEGTQNAVNGLDHGINIAIAPYKPQLRVKDLVAAAVCNLRDDAIYIAERGQGVTKYVNHERKEITRKQTDVYETPLPTAYTTDGFPRGRQEVLVDVFYNLLGNQPRSIDATGTRLVALLEGNIRAYGDWRDATKCWDVLPSALLLEEGGIKVTDVFGFDFSEGILFDRKDPRFQKDNGLNRRIGENFIAATPEDHERLVFGEEESIWKRTTNEWPRPRHLVGPYLPPDLDRSQEFWNFGSKAATGLQWIIDKRKEAYGDLDRRNVEVVVRKLRERFLDSIPRKLFPEEGPVHLKHFDERMRDMTDYDFLAASSSN